MTVVTLGEQSDSGISRTLETSTLSPMLSFQVKRQGKCDYMLISVHSGRPVLGCLQPRPLQICICQQKNQNDVTALHKHRIPFS